MRNVWNRLCGETHSSARQRDQSASSSVGGNLVREVRTTSITDVYEISQILLGRGSSAEVLIGEDRKNRRRYAIKVIDHRRKDILWRYEREKNVLRDIDHTNVVRLYEVYLQPQSMCFVMELCTGGHLGQALQQSPLSYFPERQARDYVLQLLRALVHCHERGIVHRDVKLQNVLLESHSSHAQIKVIDFGNAARFRGATPLRQVVGTTYTAAPEVFRKHYDERCDMWSLGVVTYILLSGRRPFERIEIAQNTQQQQKESSVIASILLGRYHFKHDVWQSVSNEAIHFLKCCLEMDYTKRQHAAELLLHPWLVLAESDQSLSIKTKRVAPVADRKAQIKKSIFARNTMEALSASLSLSRSPSKVAVDTAAVALEACGAESFQGGSLSARSVGPAPAQSAEPSLTRASMLAVAFAMPPSRARQLRDLFQEIDRNGNGTIERAEFVVAFQSLHPLMSDEDINLLFSVVDQDDNNSISFLEFVAATIDPREVDVRELNQAFRILDQEQKGFLTKQDLLRVLSTVPPSEEDSHESDAQRLLRIEEKVNHMLTVSDVNKDGVISYIEFIFSMAEGSLPLFERIDAESLARAPPIAQQQSLLHRLGLGRSSRYETQSLMRQLSIKQGEKNDNQSTGTSKSVVVDCNNRDVPLSQSNYSCLPIFATRRRMLNGKGLLPVECVEDSPLPDADAESNLSVVVSAGSPSHSISKTYLQRKGDFSQIVVQDEEDWSSAKKEPRSASEKERNHSLKRGVTRVRDSPRHGSEHTIVTSGVTSRARSSFATNFGDEVHSIHSADSPSEQDREEELDDCVEERRDARLTTNFSSMSLGALVESHSMPDDSSLECQSLKE